MGMWNYILRDYGAWKTSCHGGECLDLFGKHWQPTHVLAAIGGPLAPSTPKALKM